MLRKMDYVLVTGCVQLCCRSHRVVRMCCDLTGFSVMFLAGNSGYIFSSGTAFVSATTTTILWPLSGTTQCISHYWEIFSSVVVVCHWCHLAEMELCGRTWTHGSAGIQPLLTAFIGLSSLSRPYLFTLWCGLAS